MAAALFTGAAVLVGARNYKWHAPQYVADVNAAPVRDARGTLMMAPFLGGFDVPRPQLVDIDSSGHPTLFVQEWPNQLMMFQRNGDGWTWRSDKYLGLDIGEWYRFVDMDGDGRIDLLSEMPDGYIRMWRNVGTRREPRFVPQGDTIRDVDGVAIQADRQNILNAVDIDCNGRIDLFIGRVEGVVDRFEQEGQSPDGSPRFRLIAPRWEGIEILGPEATQGSAVAPPLSDTLSGPDAPPPPARHHGANTITFADITGKGTLDVFWGDFFEPGLLRIENTGSCAQPFLQNKPNRFPPDHPVITSGYNAPAFGDIDGDGNLDLVLGVIGGAYGPMRTSADNLYLMVQSPRGTWTTRSRRMISQIDVGSESSPELADLRGTGTLDLLIGNKISPHDESTGTITWFENVGTPTAPAFRERGTLPVAGQFNYAPRVADLDGDGLPDLVLGDWSNRLLWYRNTGTRQDPKWTLADTALVARPRGTNIIPALADIDGDGLIDLVLGSANGRLAVYRNTGSRSAPHFTLVSDNFQDIKFGRRSAPVLYDVDGDGRPDLLLGNEAGEVQLWRNQTTPHGEIRFVLDSSFKLQAYPLAVPAVGDLRGNGRPDILLGTGSGGIRWFVAK